MASVGTISTHESVLVRDWFQCCHWSQQLLVSKGQWCAGAWQRFGSAQCERQWRPWCIADWLTETCMKALSRSLSWRAAPGVIVQRKTLNGSLQAHALAAAQHVVPQLRRPAAAEDLAEHREALPAQSRCPIRKLQTHRCLKSGQRRQSNGPKYGEYQLYRRSPAPATKIIQPISHIRRPSQLLQLLRYEC